MVNRPADTVNTDLMFALITRGSTDDPSDVPTGWTLLASNAGRWLYYKVAGASEPATYTWTWGPGSVATRVTITTWRYGYDVSTPIDNYSNTAYTTENPILQAASFWVSNPSETLLYFGSATSATEITFIKPSTQDNDWEERYDAWDALSTFAHTVGNCDKADAGESGVINITASTDLTDKHAFAVALNVEGASPSSTPSATPSATASATPSATVSATPSSTVSATPSATPSGTPSQTPSPTATTTPSSTPSATASATPSPEGLPLLSGYYPYVTMFTKKARIRAMTR